jgi:hypothetical protein
MKTSHNKLSILTLAVVFAALSQSIAAKVELELVKPDGFRDIQINNMSKLRSAETVNKKMLDLFQRLAEKHLVGDQTLYIQVTDIDLAGDVEYMVGDQHKTLRIVKNNAPYRLVFKYHTKNKQGETLKKGESTIRNFTNVAALNNRLKHKDVVDHFEPDLEDWFKKEFK